MQATYRKKPFRITAFRVDDITEAVDWIRDRGGNAEIVQKMINFPDVNDITMPAFRREMLGTVVTLEGNMQFREGDYIIQGVEGEFYPCRGGIFERTYELVEEG